MEKTNYTAPQMEIIEIMSSDIITTSLSFNGEDHDFMTQDQNQ